MTIRKRIVLGAALLTSAAGIQSAMADNYGNHDQSWNYDHSWDHALYQTADAVALDGFFGAEGLSGAATMVRELNSIRGRLMTNVDLPGHPYTLWMLVINRPENCVDPGCLGPSDDPNNPKTRTTIFNATGAISADNGISGGVINVDFELEAGKLPAGQFILGNGSRRALHWGNGFGALIILMVDEHPIPMDAGPFSSWVEDLTTTHQPFAGPNTSQVLAVFPPCSYSSCP